MKLLKGDEVKIVLGKDKGKTGKIEKVFMKTESAMVTGVNQYKRHMKARAQGQTSEIVTITKPLAIAKVQLICPKCKKITRVGYSFKEGSKHEKVRVCKKCGKEI